jgi:hypothetical protein
MNLPPSTSQPAEDRPTAYLPVRAWEICLLVAITAFGGILRYWQMAHAPGLWYDEAIYGLDGLRVLREPGWPIFFDTNNHMREPLFMYLLAASMAFFGPEVWSIRLPSVLIGTGTIPVVWLLAREWRGPLFALVCTAFFATLRWHVHFSGLCFRTILTPLFVSLVFYYFLRMLRRGSASDAGFCGLFLGLGAYTYLSFRLVPLMLLPPMFMALHRLGRDRLHTGGVPIEWPEVVTRERMIQLLGMIVGMGAIVFTPLAVHYVRNPQHFTGRSGEVSFLRQNDGLQILSRQIRDVALMPLVRGDHVGKHNLPGPPRFLQIRVPSPAETTALWADERAVAQLEGRPVHDPHGTGVPVFPPVTGLLFYVGLGALILGAIRSTRELALLSWLLVGMLASVLSFGAPNMLRLLYLTPLAAMLVTLGAFLAAGWAVARIHRLSWIAIAAVLIWQCTIDLQRLRQWPAHPMVPIEFNSEIAELAHSLRPGESVPLPLRIPTGLGIENHPTLRFLAQGRAINPPMDSLGSDWWEFHSPFTAPLSPIPGSESAGEPRPIMHPSGFLFGEVHRFTRRTP